MPTLDRDKTIERNDLGKKLLKRIFHVTKSHVIMVICFVLLLSDLLLTVKTARKLDYHRVTKHGRKLEINRFTCSECMLNFHSFYILRKHKQTFHRIKKQPAEAVSIEFDFETIMGDHAIQDLRDELNSVKHFLVHSEAFRGKHNVFNISAAELNPQLTADILRTVFSKLDNAAKINIILGFVLRNIETGDYRYHYSNFC